MSLPETEETPAASRRWLWWTGLLGLLGASFAVSFAVNAPARWMVQGFDMAVTENAVSGSVMHGQIALDGGFALDWHVRPWTSLTTLRVTADVTLRGPGTDLAGRVAVGPSAYRIGPIDGRGDAQVLQAVFPTADLHCAGPVVAAGLRVDVTRRTVIGSGTLRSDGLTCKNGARNVQTFVIPPLGLSFTALDPGSQARVTAGPLPVATATARGDGRLELVLRKEGAALIPGMPAGADTSVDLPLSGFFR